jgi:hypothetical protein
MFSNLRIDQFFAMGFERAECTLLVDTHQPAVARNIASQNSSEPALYAIFTQLRLPNTALPS